jgi:hypothetical protein
MKKKPLLFFLLFTVGIIILSGCQPKIYGQIRRKRDKKCGCMIYKSDKSELCFSYEIEPIE